MPEIFELYGKLVADTAEFNRNLRTADTRLAETSRNILATEKRAQSLGVATATSARSFDKLQGNLNLAQQKLNATSSAFQKGEASAKQMASALMSVDRAANAANNRLKDTDARLADIKNKQSSAFLGDVRSAASGAILAGAGLGIAGLKEAVDRTRDADNANRALTSSATEAGKAYSVLAREALEFGKNAGISNVEAQKTTAELQRLLTLAGKSSEFSKYSKGFLDVAAARGVDFKELETLFQGIISGTDDALNRFGKQDPSKLAEAYAKKIGKANADALTEQEKIQSRLDAFEKDFEQFAGKNTERLSETATAAQQASTSLNNIADGLAQAATQSIVFRDGLSAVQSILSAIQAYDPIIIRIRLQEGESPRKLAQEAAGGGPSYWDSIKAGLTTPFAALLYPYDMATKGTDEATRIFNEAVSPDATYQRKEDMYFDEFSRMQSALDKQKQQSDTQRAQNSVDTYTGWQQQQLEAQKKANEKQAKEDDKASKKREAIEKRETAELERELEKRRQLVKSFNDFRSQSAINATENPFQKLELERQKAGSDVSDRFKDLGPNAVRQAVGDVNKEFALKSRDLIKETVDGIKSLVADKSSNPWVKFYADAQDQIEKATEATKYLSKETQRAALAATQANNRENLYNARVDSALRATSLRSKADEIFFNREMSGADQIWSQYNAVNNANVSQDIKDRRLADIGANANIADIPNQLRGVFYEALIKEAKREEEMEREGARRWAELFNILKNPLLVKGVLASFEVNAKGATVQQTSSPVGSDTAKAMEVYGNPVY